VEGLTIIMVESTPKDGIVLTLGYPARIEEDLAISVELVMVIDDVSLVIHALLGVLVNEVHQLLF